MTTREPAALPAAVDEAAAVLAAAAAAGAAVVVLAHIGPDADALGSALALGGVLHARGAAVQVAFAEPDAVPEALAPLDVHGLLTAPDRVVAAPAVLVSCDAAEPARLGSLARLLDTAGRTVMIDHHASNPGFGDVQVLDPTAEATVVLVRQVLAALAAPLDRDTATCLYVGLVGDTRQFRGASATGHRLAAELLEAGVVPEQLGHLLGERRPFAWLAGLGAALARARLDPAAAGGQGLVHTTIGLADVRRYRSDDIDGVVGQLRRCAEAEVAACLIEVAEHRWRVSLRSGGAVDVGAAAIALGGGGHRAAAGLTRDGSAEEVLAALLAALA